MTEDEAIDLALQHQQAGRLQEAAALYQQVIENNPRCPDALNLLGAITYQSGNYQAALELISRAIESAPHIPMYYSNAGPVLIALGREDQALACYRKAVELQPDNVEAMLNIAHLLKRQDKTAEALELYRTALRIRPDYAGAHYNMGNTLKELGRYDEALVSYRAAQQYRPSFADAYVNAGLVLAKMGRYDEALQNYNQALQLQPASAEIYNNIGIVLDDLGRQDEAAQQLARALELQPDNAEAYCNLGRVELNRMNYAEAIACSEKALQLRPDFAEPYINIGSALNPLGRLDEAIAAYRKALALNPEDAGSYSNLLFTMLYHPGISAGEQYAETLRYAECFEAPLIGRWPQHDNSCEAGRRLRIGYVSADFQNHSVAYFIERVLSGHDKAQFEVYCYYNHARQDQVTERLRNLAEHWRQVQTLDDEQMVALIRADGIDILVDLSGHTAFNRLPVFARKPAPVQVTWMGYCGTSGLAAMDYRMTDEYLDPAGISEQFHTEKLVRLPASAAFHPDHEAPEVNDLPAMSAGSFTLASLNNPMKLNGQVVALWARLLEAIPHARLMLGNARATQEKWLLELFADHGIAADRLLLQPRMNMREYLAVHQQIDLGLDPFPYNGGTTTFHALWMGVPVISLAGEKSVSRSGASIMGNLGLTQFVVHSEEEYFELAVHMASNLEELNELRHNLRGMIVGNTADDPTGYARGVETAYQSMWQTWCGQGK